MRLIFGQDQWNRHELLWARVKFVDSNGSESRTVSLWEHRMHAQLFAVKQLQLAVSKWLYYALLTLQRFMTSSYTVYIYDYATARVAPYLKIYGSEHTTGQYVDYSCSSLFVSLLVEWRGDIDGLIQGELVLKSAGYSCWTKVLQNIRLEPKSYGMFYRSALGGRLTQHSSSMSFVIHLCLT